ncbi:MAG: PD40 domain-containing protein [Elusimicrobia bacterium]|nr:PD40 domain-containing protein [Elusimicrobiota bacterium]
MIFFKSKLEKGIDFLKTGKYDDAIGHFSQMVSYDPKDCEAQFSLAKSYFKKNDIAKTKENLLKCLELQPNEEIIKEMVEITNLKKISSDQHYNTYLNFSSDGKKIIFTSVRRDTNGDGRMNHLDNGGIYLIDSDGQNERQIAEDSYINSDCSFSPDGKYAVYLSRRRDTNGDGKIDNKDSAGIYIFDLEHGNEQLLMTDETYNKKPVFTPDGQSVIFCGWRRFGGNSGIYSVDVKTKTIKELVPDLYENTSPVISSDGRWVLYSSWRDDTNGDGKIDIRDSSAIYMTDIRNRQTTRLTKDSYDNSFPEFSSDGKKIIYLSRRRDTNGDGKIDSLDFSGVYVMDVESKISEEVVSDNFFNKFISFTKDEKNIVFLGSWRRKYRIKGKDIRDIFENKGIYIVNVKTKKTEMLVSDKYFSSSLPQVSSNNKLAYLSWRKHTRRGIFVRDIYKLPSVFELKEIIEQNL